MQGKWTRMALFTVFAAMGVAGCGGPLEEEFPFDEQEELTQDEAGEVSALEQDKPPCKNVKASPKLLWPPNHKFHTVTLSGKDGYGEKFKVTIKKVTQDEPLNGQGDGNTEPDAKWVDDYKDRVKLRAERSGQGDGRVYRITFTAKDSKGKTCTGTVFVGVPHDQGGHSTPVDSGYIYDSFGY
ncbi:hypothetical protein JRI60_47580 [Archangium violaceum]|uniref:hypothetical protein n=1 Tax=Archangium violaceum TaxID=83451 RepID=UPI00194F6B0B|nr:hypothetical protein [Archangium violaceum]QRN96582.1 hypothetical protein JRI60_47580 [Archangium violaceum]